jgi:hypothetical protein
MASIQILCPFGTYLNKLFNASSTCSEMEKLAMLEPGFMQNIALVVIGSPQA